MRAHDPHPWLEDFLGDPAGQTRLLVRGLADLDRLSGAEPPEAARAIFCSPSTSAEAVKTLDEQMVRLLVELRSENIPTTNSGRRAVADALQIVSDLHLTGSARTLRESQFLWLSWAAAHPIDSRTDVQAELFSTWAMTQDVCQDLPSLEPFWLNLCELAGESYPASYLGIALLGLRKLAATPGLPSERLWMSGLLLWGVARSPDSATFMAQWRALRVLFPRTNHYWRTAVSATLSQSAAHYLDDEIRELWFYDVSGRMEASVEADHPIDLWCYSGTDHELDAILHRKELALSLLQADIDCVIDQREQYARASGNSEPLRYAASKLGMALIESGPTLERFGRAKLGIRLAQTVLFWAADSVYGWALWRDALRNAGWTDAAEIVGWETIRRFPENEWWRNQLALLQVRLGKIDDAKRLLLATIDRFPQDAVSRSQLAEIYINQREYTDALALLEVALDDGIADSYIWSAMIRATAESDGVTAALAVARDALKLHPGESYILQLYDDLESGRYMTGHVQQFPAFGPSLEFTGLPGPVREGGLLRRVQAQIFGMASSSEQDAAIQVVRTQLRLNPHSEYAKLLMPPVERSEEVTGFAAAFLRAFNAKDESLFEALATTYRARSNLVDAAKALIFQDGQAAERLSGWFSRAVNVESRVNQALRGFMRRRFHEGSSSSSAFSETLHPSDVLRVFASNDNIEEDILEVVLSSVILPIAA